MPSNRTKQEIIDSIIEKQETLSKEKSTQSKRMQKGGRTSGRTEITLTYDLHISSTAAECDLCKKIMLAAVRH